MKDNSGSHTSCWEALVPFIQMHHCVKSSISGFKAHYQRLAATWKRGPRGQMATEPQPQPEGQSSHGDTFHTGVETLVRAAVEAVETFSISSSSAQWPCLWNKEARVCVSVCLSACVSVCVGVCVCLRVILCVSLCMWVSVCLCVCEGCLSVCVSVFVCLWGGESVCVSICVYVCLPVCVCVYLCVSFAYELKSSEELLKQENR